MGPLTNRPEVSSVVQFIEENAKDETRIAISDNEKLLDRVSEKSVEVFSAMYEQQGPNILGLSEVGVCFLSSSRSTADDTCCNSLYLSHLLFGLEVIGIHNSEKFEITSPSLSSSRVLQSLLMVWNQYFTDHPTGRMIQCCYGDGSAIVQYALENSHYKERVIVLGINTYTPITHEYSYLYRSLGNLFAMPQGIRLPFSPNSQGIFLRGLRDPVFIPCFLHVLYELIEKVPFHIDNGFQVVPEVAAVLRRPISLKSQSKVSLVTEDSEHVEKDRIELQWLMAGSRRVIQERDPWSEERLDRCVNISIICLRLLEYTSLMLLKVQCNETKDIFSNMSFLSVMFTYYFMLGLSELTLLQTDCSFLYRKARSIALCIASLAEVITFFNFAANSYLAIKDGVIAINKGITLSQNQVNVDRHYFSRLGVFCCDSTALMYRASFGGKQKFKGIVQRFSKKFVSKPDLLQIEKGTESGCIQITKVDQLYYRYIRQRRVLLKGLTVNGLAILTLSFALPDIVTGSTIEYVMFAARAIFGILYIVFATYLFRR